MTTSVGMQRPLWYRRFRGAAFANTVGSLAWTLLIILPFPPFSYLPPIMVGGGPGTWFVVAYLVFLAVGTGGFGAFSGFLFTIEVHENRSINSFVMWPAFVLLGIGFAASCVFLALAGAYGGYASAIENASVTSVENLLAAYVYPITASTFMAVVGASLALYATVRAGWPST
jgi:hypothetical protein